MRNEKRMAKAQVKKITIQSSIFCPQFYRTDSKCGMRNVLIRNSGAINHKSSNCKYNYFVNKSNYLSC